MRAYVCLLGSAVLMWSTASWGEPAKGPPVVSNTQVQAPSAKTQQFEQMRRSGRPPARRGFVLSPGPASKLTAKGYLHAFVDGIALLAVEVTAEQQTVLRRVGAQDAKSEKDVRHHTIFQDRYYRELKVAPPAGQPCAGCAKDRLTGPDPKSMTNQVGKYVVLSLQRDRDDRPWVVALTE